LAAAFAAAALAAAFAAAALALATTLATLVLVLIWHLILLFSTRSQTPYVMHCSE
jgi:hypothetical protein